MIVKIRSTETNGWIYLDNVQKITKDAGNWCKTDSEEENVLSRFMYPKTTQPVEIGELHKENIADSSKMVINSNVLRHYDHMVDGDQGYSNSTDGNIYPMIVIELRYLSGMYETYAMSRSTDVFIINNEGKTIERLN